MNLPTQFSPSGTCTLVTGAIGSTGADIEAIYNRVEAELGAWDIHVKNAAVEQREPAPSARIVKEKFLSIQQALKEQEPLAVMKRLFNIALVAWALATSAAVSAEDALSYPKGNGLRIVSAGHSWVSPAMNTFDPIAQAAGFDAHHLRTHIGGASMGSARSIWAAEQGLDYPGRPKDASRKAILLPAIETGQWDVMTWGEYPWDKTEDYTHWIDVCLKANPGMVFYIQDGWPYANDGMTASGQYDIEKFLERQKQLNAFVQKGVDALNARYPGKIHVIPLGDGVCALLKLHLKKQLPYVKEVDSQNQPIPGIYRDGGHLDETSGMGWFEGYIYYATLYKKSPELIPGKFKVPNEELDKVFRKVAWQVVTRHPLSGVTVTNGNRTEEVIK